MAEDRNIASMELMHELLKQMQGSLSRLEDGQRKHDKRFSTVERQLAGLRGDLAVVHEITADQRDDYDGLKTRIERIERRLELTDA
jgi:septal ring factor EnvC (AmiA/AmiB activator)